MVTGSNPVRRAILRVIQNKLMADVAQLVEPRVVISVVVGSSPIIRPIYEKSFKFLKDFFILSSCYLLVICITIAIIFTIF